MKTTDVQKTSPLRRSRRQWARVPSPSFACVAVIVSLACDQRQSAPKPLVRRAEFGVLFGGQIQERRELPFELDRSKQTLGFRIDFNEPLGADTEIDWRIDKPARSVRRKAGRHGKPSPGGVQLGPDAERRPVGSKETARTGEVRFDRTVTFEPGDPLGLWNVRVVVRGKVALDRPFEVFDPEDREKNGSPDAGF